MAEMADVHDPKFAVQLMGTMVIGNHHDLVITGIRHIGSTSAPRGSLVPETGNGIIKYDDISNAA
jgi:hypothetical protein